MEVSLLLNSLVVGPLQVNCFVLACEETHEGIIIDPGENAEGILEMAESEGVSIVEVIATHGHFDHIGRAGTVVKKTGAPFAVHQHDQEMVEHLQEIANLLGMEADPPPAISRYLAEGDVIKFGNESLGILHTPGHCPGNITLTWPGHAIVGDTLFAGSIGRTDLEGGDMELLMSSIKEKILPLGDITKIYPGHGPFSTIGVEKMTNPFLN
jgi:glyoxylase-like metal-dependent hydrolase (beta-lactamase superfamily II)